MKGKLFLALLRSSILCIRGTWSTVGDAETQANLLVVAKSVLHVALPSYFTFCIPSNIGITVLILFSFILVYTLVLNRAYNRAGEGNVEGSVKSR